jgi:fucose permease
LLKKTAGATGAILVIGLSGSALVPLVYGRFADVLDPRVAYWVLLPCYIYLGFYAFYGYRIRTWVLRKNFSGDAYLTK